ncbi:hypothetical protein [Hyphomicrobium sp.]|uniref:hypothetical protein n=1 Tax=Hyphomicrobium sp. TaxID=82 RepID=UPI002E38166C|nr:hypothetical protein [Hyphomicrobium sp.]HEX2841417.1 hypothetical protein [Hyphomicrobium sp.]
MARKPAKKRKPQVVRRSGDDIRREMLATQWDEIEKMAMGMQSGMLEAFEIFGTTLEEVVGNRGYADIHLAVIFELLPPVAQRRMLDDPRLHESATILPLVKEFRDKTKRPKKGKS